MEKANGGKNIPAKPSRWRKGFGANSLQISEYDSSASALVGGIVEKGFFSAENKPKLAPTPSPRPTVLPFPVARHRSHGPHWAPIGSEKSGRIGDDRDEEEEEDLMEFGPLAAASANPVQRKEKKGMDFSQLKELAKSEGSSPTQKKKQDKSFLESIEQKKANEVTEKSNKRSSPIGTANNGLPQNMPPDNSSQAQDVFMVEMDSRSVKEVSQDVIVETREETMEDREEMEPGFSDVSKRQRQADIEKSKMSTMHLTSSYTPSNMGNEQDSTGIDAENRARLERMSADEIAEAQAEILDKMSPAVIEALRKRGQNKLKKQPGSIPARGTKGEVGNVQDDTMLVKEERGSPPSVIDTSTTLTTPASTATRRGQGDNGLQNLSPNKSLWDSWSERVEAVRELRFSLDGDVVETDFGQVTKTGNVSTKSGYNTDNVSERDLLRTEGDPAAAGYTIKEAIALTRSVIPGQRALALHLLASVLDKALHKIIQNKVCYNVKVANIMRFIDWAAVWAYALGPEPELALSLRMSLDDNHNSVVLACAKVIQGVLSFDTNEIFFDISEKSSSYQKDMCTAPIFRSRPDIDVGFLQGGFWKFNAKPANILPFGEDIDNNDDNGKTEDEPTIQDDVVVAGQDIVAGLVRMGILPRIHYLLETDPSDVLEECLISILVAIARHSPTCARAIMKCQRLVQTVVRRFTTKEPMEVNTSKIKSVTLLRVLARSEKKNCVDFLRNGVFRSATWHLYQHAPPLDRWIELGKEKCKLSSALMVEQLRFWKVCIQYGYCVANFSDFFPALCMWLNVPTFEQLINKSVLSEFAAITKEAFFVFGALTRRLPNFYSHMHVSNQVTDGAADELESWSWVHVGPIVDFAIKWTALRSNPCMSNFFEWQKGNRSSSIVQHLPTNSLLWLVSAALHMLSGVLDKVIPEDAISLPGGSLPWLPEFVPKIGLDVIKNGFLSFSGMNDACSFTQYLCRLRHQGEHESSFASVSCLHELVKVVISVDKLIQLAKPSISTPLAHSHSSSREELVLSGGIVKSSIPELRDSLATFMKLINSEWQWVQSTEIFGRGGPAPGVGVGWGAAGGGFWSKDVLLAQTDAGLLISLLEVFQIVSANDLLTVEDMDFTMQKINSAFDICLILGPRDRSIMEKVLDTLLQVPVLKYLDLSIRHFITLNKDLKPFGWNYAEKDYQLFSKVLASHFRNRWLTVKKKLKALDQNSGPGKMSSKKGGLLETIHEDLDMSNTTPQQDNCPSLAVEWAHQRLPLPMQWFLSPISTINGIAHADPSIPSRNIEMENHTDFLEIAKAGLFFLLGIEVMSAFVGPEIECSVQRVPLAWKLHSLSVTLLGGMGVLGEEKSRDIYEALQEVYGKLLHESWLTKSNEVILEGTEKFSAQTGKKKSVEFLCFQSEVHESYSTFMETLMEQFAAASYGDLIYGRQVVIYLHRCVESSVRLAAWNALSNARVLELLPPLGNCLASGEGYLEPIEVNECILEAYLKSWVSGALDRASTRGSMAFTLVLHHLSSFVFCCFTSYKLLLRNKLVKSLLRDYSRKPQHEGMMLDFVHYQKPGQREGSSMPKHEVDKRFKLLAEACDGNSSLLHDVETLKLSFHRKLCS